MAKNEQVLVFLRGALGDCLMTLPFLAGLAEYWQTSGLNLVGDPKVLRLLANQGFVCGVFSQDAAGWAGLYATPAKLPPDLESFVLQHRRAAVMARRNDDPIVDGLTALGLDVMPFPSRPPENKRIHLADHIFETTGIPRLESAPLIRHTGDGLRQAEQIAEDMGLEPGTYLVVHPGSGSESKNYPLKYWLETARHIEADIGLRSVFVLGPADSKLGEVLQAEDARLARNMPLDVLAGFISRAVAYAGCDSGVSHLAAGLGVPTVAVFGPTDPVCWAPRGPQVSVLWEGEVEGKTDWPGPEKVVDALKSLCRRSGATT